MTPYPTQKECEHGVVEKYCFNCKFKEKYGMKIEIFNNHHYVRLKDVETLRQNDIKSHVGELEGMKVDVYDGGYTKSDGGDFIKVSDILSYFESLNKEIT